MCRVHFSFNNEIVSVALFMGTYEACVEYIRGAVALRSGRQYEIVAPSGHLMSYVL